MRGISASDLRHAVRGLARTPSVTIAAVTCLALGIGATTAIYSAVRRGLLQPLPYPAADRLVAVHRVTPNSGKDGTWPHSAPNYVDLAGSARQLDGLAAMQRTTALIDVGGEAVQASRLNVTGNLFGILRATAARGRLIAPDDDRSDRPAVAVVSDDFWRSRFAAERGVVGRTVAIDGMPTTIIGILPADFRVPHGTGVLRADLWMPIRFSAEQRGNRFSNYLLVLGRLRDGATPAAAEAELRGIWSGLAASFPNLVGEDVRVAPLVAESTASVRTPLLLLSAAVGIVLLIAATNVASLLLARGVQRRRQIAVRTALGATRWDAMRPALVESLVISLVGAALGLLVAFAGVRTIGILAAERIPQLRGLEMDGAVVAFALPLALVVAALCGVLPAWRASQANPQDALRSGRGGGTGRDSHRALHVLVVIEMALSLVLLIGAGLVLRGFTTLLQKAPGLDVAHTLTMRVSTAPIRYADHATVGRFLEPALAAIEEVPGVERAAAIDAMPYFVWGSNSSVHYEGRPMVQSSRLPVVEQRTVTPGLFAVTGQRLVSGRLLADADDADAPRSVVVNQALVRRDFAGADPVGKRYYLTDTTFGTIVGVVTDVQNMGPVSDPVPEMYRTYRATQPGAAVFSLMIRVRGSDPAAVTAGVRAAIRSVDPSAAVADVRPMGEVIARSLGRPRFYFGMIGAFAAVAVILAIAGLYGVVTYVVTQRTREMAIRAALGSSRARIVWQAGSRGVAVVTLGLAIGAGGARAVTRLMESMLYGVSPVDASTWVLAVLGLLAAGSVACVVPAIRASRADPILALRAD